MNLITHSLFIIIISLAKTRNPCKLSLTRVILFFVPLTVLFSNQFLEDLDKIWELRQWIPDPTKPILPPKGRK